MEINFIFFSNALRVLIRIQNLFLQIFFNDLRRNIKKKDLCLPKRERGGRRERERERERDDILVLSKFVREADRYYCVAEFQFNLIYFLHLAI